MVDAIALPRKSHLLLWETRTRRTEKLEIRDPHEWGRLGGRRGEVGPREWEIAMRGIPGR